MKKKGEQRRPASVGFYQFLRDVFIAAINKGQVPVILGALVILSMIWRMPEADVGKLVFRLLDAAERERLIGYMFGAISLMGWFFHARYQRKLITKEMERLSGERNELQERELGKKLKSSQGQRR